MKPIFYHLFLDDIRHPYDCLRYTTKFMPQDKSSYAKLSWVIARSGDEFANIITERFSKGEFPSLISFDHDLADDHYDQKMYNGAYPEKFAEQTGNECAKFLVEFCIEHDLEMPICWVHSMNPIGAQRIQNTLEDFKRFKERMK